MEPKNKKSSLILIIILIIICLPAAIYGGILHFTGSGSSDNNPKHEFYYNGKLYFYNYNNLLGTYTCTNKICDYAYETNDDSNYQLNYYKDSSVDQIKIVNNKYAFIIDTADTNVSNYYENVPINLYDIVNKRSLATLKAVKNYTKGLENNYFIVLNNESKWGVISLGDSVSLAIPYSYDYIGVHNVSSNNHTTLDSDIFLVKDTQGSKLVSNKNADLTNYFNATIIDYNANDVITYNSGYYYLNNYSNNLIISYGFKYMKFIGEYVGVINTSNQFYLINASTGSDVSNKYAVNSIEDVSYQVTTNGVELTINNKVVETVK